MEAIYKRKETVPTFWAKIYISGPIEIAKQIIRRDCFEVGLCITIEPTTFIYTGGEEEGYVVGLINYPRFPCDSAKIKERATSLAHILRTETYQHSVLIMFSDETVWYTVRE